MFQACYVKKPQIEKKDCQSLMAKSVLLRDGMNLIRLSSEVFDNVSHLVCVCGGAAVSKMMYKFVLLSPL